jgi:DUF4097 and DUF4098 domain-containing protein YvlB
MKTPAPVTSTLSLAAVLALLLAAPPAAADTPINRRTAADPRGLVEISNTAGRVTVTGWDRNEVEVKGSLGDGSERLDFTTASKVTRVKVVLPNKSWGVEDTDLIVKVPIGSTITVNTVSADIEVHGVQGSQRLQSVSADVTTEAGAEDVECKTVSGDLTVAGTGQKGLLTITTVSGDATVSRVAGEVNGNTVSGNFTLGVGETARSRLRTTSGDLSLTSQLAPDGRLDVESISGDVRLDLAQPVNAEFEVSSFSGEIRNCFGPKATRTDEYAPGKELRFVEGKGAARVRIKTLSGDVNVCRK